MIPARIFNPVPPLICEQCGQPLAFVKIKSGKWRPCNPDGSDHWDGCRDIRYAKAKSGECREKTFTNKHGFTCKEVWWDGGPKPFFVLMSGYKPKPAGWTPHDGDPFLPIEELRAHAAKHGYTVIEL